MIKQLRLAGIFALVLAGSGCSTDPPIDNGLRVGIGSRNSISSPDEQVDGTSVHDEFASGLYQFELFVNNHGQRIEKEDFRGPLRLVIGGADRIFDAKVQSVRGQHTKPDGVSVADNEVLIAPFSLDRYGGFTVAFKVEREAGSDRVPAVLGVLAEIEGVRAVELAYVSS